ncbi:hypothetical protein Y1Q_0018918 [Alligator mississippiensis]|uniref:Uncharacterized protein n=1 Tax=Alligator mississippiensis TaxID=8496 RepID=A0A151M372_ALLMI|nr:hypothetical protein Y1Q_0018918 [Alligator mississippiensis]
MSQLFRDCSLFPNDQLQEEPSVTLQLLPLSSSIPWSSTDDELEEVGSQEETSPAEPASKGSGSRGSVPPRAPP